MFGRKTKIKIKISDNLMETSISGDINKALAGLIETLVQVAIDADMPCEEIVDVFKKCYKRKDEKNGRNTNKRK